MSWSFGALLAWATVGAPALFDPADLAGMAAAVVATVAVLLVARLAATLPAAPAPVRISAPRARIRPTAPVRWIDPDAAGRPRSRAPGSVSAA